MSNPACPGFYANGACYASMGFLLETAKVRSIARGLACSAILIFLGGGAFGHEDPDRPVSSGDQDQSGPRIRAGAVGRLTDGDGRPVEGALIEARSLDHPALPIPEIAILSDRDGRYTWPLLPGTYEISILAEGYRCAPKRAVVDPGQAVRVDFKLERAP